MCPRHIKKGKVAMWRACVAFAIALSLAVTSRASAGSTDDFKLMLDTKGLVFRTARGWSKSEYTPVSCIGGNWKWKDPHGASWIPINLPFYTGIKDGGGLLLERGCKVAKWWLEKDEKYLGEPEMRVSELRLQDGDWCEVLDTGECVDLDLLESP